MGIFDLFGKDPKTKTEREGRSIFSTENSTSEEKKDGPIAVYKPTSFSDVEEIIVSLKSGKNAIIHLTELKRETGLRVLDMLCGAIYALNGGVYEMDKDVFMFSPCGVEVK